MSTARAARTVAPMQSEPGAEMIGTARPVGRGAIWLVLATAAVVLATLFAGSETARAASATRAERTHVNAPPPLMVGGCTMAVLSLHTTIEAQIANAADFCELVSQALADE